ncbi:gamma-cadinene synthase-like [Sesamum indicum]|uniref:Gamma-cadinene synthase-like n=1 Tax=Sesamum indicum TaxID=4182 RepID=A0A6I9TCI4_SESIN|nr:gamma-cadinene synthase-like [Sesamum indicum]
MDVRQTISSSAPTMWDNTFTSSSVDVNQLQEKYAQDIEELTEEARSMLIAKGSTAAETLILIDTLERLGVAYHFEQEIEDQLQEIFQFHSKNENHYDLFTTALQFRLLRQHRYFVSSSVFDKFKNEDNEFKETLKSDVKGLLSLYEAAQLRIHGETILEEAVAFTTHHLKLMLQQLECPLQDQVKRALQHSLHRGVPRIQTRHFISFYETDDSNNQLLLKLARLDFNYLQNLYKKEFHDLTRWWNEFDLKSKLPYARDRLVEAYFWGIALHFKPQDSYARVDIAKSVQMLTTINDTYDSYATLEDAHLFTEILERWDVNEINRLPNYMKIVYKFLLSIYDDYEVEASKQAKSYAVCYAKETMKQLCKAYDKVLKWAMGQVQIPTFEEYVANMMVTSCVYVLLSPTISAAKSAPKETIDWLMGEPKIVAAAAKIGRYLNDLGSYERESKGGNLPVAVRCYMKQYGVSKEEALDKFVEQVEDAWKDLNTEWITQTSILGRDIVAEQLLTYARAAEITYENCEDGITNPEKYTALFVDPILI